jgi:hypothetical protein
MKFVLIALLVLLPAASNAASPEQEYFAARDAYIKRLERETKPNVVSDDLTRREQLARAELEMRLKQIIGSSELKGVAPEAKVNLDTLLKGDQGFGMLDGLVYSSPEDKTRIIVTTDALLNAWLRGHRKWWGKNDIPAGVEPALRSEPFYTQAISTDAAVQKYAELPVKKPTAASFVFAMLNGRAQDIGPWAPKEIMVSVLMNRRLFLVTAPAETTIEPMPECVALWDKAVAQAQKVLEEPDGPKARSRKPASSFEKIQEEGHAAFHRCFVERAKGDKAFSVLTRQAQSIIDALPAK